MNQHCGELVSVCEAYLAGVILRENGTQNLNEELMVRTGEPHRTESIQVRKNYNREPFDKMQDEPWQATQKLLHVEKWKVSQFLYLLPEPMMFSVQD